MKTKSSVVTKKVCMVLTFCLFAFLPFNINAQTFTQRIQTSTAGEGVVIIHHDPLIDLLVNGKPAETPAKQPEKTATVKTKTVKAQTAKTVATLHEPAVAGNKDESDSTATVAVKRYKATGYRVQVFRGSGAKNDRQQAEAAGGKIRNAYPDEDVYVEFFAPDWTCRVGNYRDIDDARRMRDELRKMGFDAATIVKGKIIISIPQQ